MVISIWNLTKVMLMNQKTNFKEELLNEAQKQWVLRLGKEGGFTEEDAVNQLRALRESDMLNRCGLPGDMEYLLK